MNMEEAMAMGKERVMVKETEKTMVRGQEKQWENEQLVQRGQQWGKHWG